jgi:hypothetical protein
MQAVEFRRSLLDDGESGVFFSNERRKGASMFADD